VDGGERIRYRLELRNRSAHALNGTQVVLDLPEGTTPADHKEGLVQVGDQLVLTVGRLAAGERMNLDFALRALAQEHGESHGKHRAHEHKHGHDRMLKARVTVRSATAMPVKSNLVVTRLDD
jgi:uncharacterized repeat protein (TIGR01451 family)